MTVSTDARKPSDSEMREHFFRIFDRALAVRYTQVLLGGRQRIRLSPRQQQQLQDVCQSSIFRPRLDLCDDPDNPHITASLELPGVKKEDIAIQLQDCRIVISGDRRSALPSDSTLVESRYPVQEVKYGRFQRVITVPAGTQASEISASLTDGMLVLSWPRHPLHSEPAHRIEVS